MFFFCRKICAVLEDFATMAVMHLHQIDFQFATQAQAKLNLRRVFLPLSVVLLRQRGIGVRHWLDLTWYGRVSDCLYRPNLSFNCMLVIFFFTSSLLHFFLPPSDHFPNINSSPVISPFVRMKRLAFKCEFESNTNDTAARFEVTWYEGSKKINQTDILRGLQRNATLQNNNSSTEKQLFSLGTIVSFSTVLWNMFYLWVN